MMRFCVIGSLNMDLVTTVPRFPKPGETMYGKAFGTYPGGKGANQAVALAQLGADVRMVGKLGDDLFGNTYREILSQRRVNQNGVDAAEGISTGVAVIEVDARGENHIVIVPGANGRVTSDYIDSKTELIEACDILLLQLEIPVPTILHVAASFKKQKKTIILDPAPAQKLPKELFPLIDFITPNEHEAEALTGIRINNSDDAVSAAKALFSSGVSNVIIKQGKRGAFLYNSVKTEHVPGFHVEVADTTAAGDAFNAGFAFALGNNQSLQSCIKYGNAVAAITCKGLGAQKAMPAREQVEQLMGNI